MADVSDELIYDMLKHLQSETAGLKEAWRENGRVLDSIRLHMIAVQQDIQNIYGILGRHDARLYRIERRLDIVEVG
jgi:hypothetical protein